MAASSAHVFSILQQKFLHRRMEVWGTVVLCVLVCLAIAFMHVQHLRALTVATQSLQSLRLARVELARGMLAVSLAGAPDSPYELEHGLALLRQAMQSLAKDADSALQVALDRFQESLTTLKAAKAPSHAGLTAVNVSYHALDRQAEQLDGLSRQRVASLREALNRKFWAAMAVSGSLMAGVVGLAMLAGRARRQAETARRDLARRHEITLRSIGDGVIVADIQGRVELLNAQAEALTGWTDVEARGKPLAQVFHLTSEAAPERDTFQSLAAPADAAGHAVLLSRDGATWPVEQTVASIRTDAGKMAGSVLVFRDRTKERTFQQALAESEQHYRTLANSGTALIWTSDTEKLCNYFNDTWLAFTGRTLEEELGYGWAEGVHPEDLERCVAVYTQAFDKRESFIMEYRLMHASGDYRWIVDTGGPRYSVQGDFLGYIGHCLDISERKQAEAELQESEARFRTLADSAPEGIFIQMEGRFAYMNVAAARMLGAHDQEEMLGEEVVNSVHPTHRELVRQHIRHLKEEGRQVPAAERLLLRRDGSSLEVEVAAVPFALSGKKGALVFFHEIGPLKRAAEDMRKAKEDAESANLAKSEFLANMSHEIRTPLNGVLGMLQLLGTTQLNLEQHEYVHTAIQASRRLTRLLSDILDLSRIESGKMTLQEAEFELAGLRESVLEVFALSAQEKGLQLDFHWESDLPSKLVGDEARLRQILFNLVGNAIKFTDKGGVRVAAMRLPGASPSLVRVLFTVEDTGIGISDSLLKTIFEPFSQAEAAYSRRFQGAGLGLSIVRKLVALLGGELCIDSAPGVGSCVYLVLPIQAVSSHVSLGERVLPARNSQADADDKVHILFVEDDEVNSMAGVKLLEKMGYAAIPAMNGREALEILAAQDIDLILMDVQMPVLDGLSATREIRNSDEFGEKAAIPIIAMTAYAMAGDRDQFLAAGMDDYIAKPMDVETLSQTLHRMLGRRLPLGSAKRAPAAFA